MSAPVHLRMKTLVDLLSCVQSPDLFIKLNLMCVNTSDSKHEPQREVTTIYKSFICVDELFVRCYYVHVFITKTCYKKIDVCRVCDAIQILFS